MIVKVYSIFDTAAAVYRRPFYCPADGEAMRVFYDLSIDADHEIGKHPEDYSLFRIAKFDDNKGCFLDVDKQCLVTALECIAASRNVQSPHLELVAGDKTDA